MGTQQLKSIRLVIYFYIIIILLCVIHKQIMNPYRRTRLTYYNKIVCVFCIFIILYYVLRYIDFFASIFRSKTRNSCYTFYVSTPFLVLVVLGCVGSMHTSLKGPLLCTALFHHRVHYIK